MDIVEQRLAGLENLPERMTAIESQFLQLRKEMRAEFSAVRSELRAEMRSGDNAIQKTLRDEIRTGDEETRRVLREEIAGLGTRMRVLHEALVEQIKLIQEGRPNRPRPRR